MKMHILFLNGKPDSTQKSPREACTCLQDKKLSEAMKEFPDAYKRFKRQIEKAESLEEIAMNFRRNAGKELLEFSNAIAECFLTEEMGENMQKWVRETLEKEIKKMFSK